MMPSAATGLATLSSSACCGCSFHPRAASPSSDRGGAATQAAGPSVSPKPIRRQMERNVARMAGPSVLVELTDSAGEAEMKRVASTRVVFPLRRACENAPLERGRNRTTCFRRGPGFDRRLLDFRRRPGWPLASPTGFESEQTNVATVDGARKDNGLREESNNGNRRA